MPRFLIVVILLFGTHVHAESLWDHGGSIVRLTADGNKRMFQFAYSAPGLPVKAGNVVFNGVKSGEEYIGTAYSWWQNCPPSAYEARGPITNDQRRVVVTGKTPILDQSTCKVVEYRDIALIFNFRDPNTSQPAINAPVAPPTPPASTSFPITGNVVVCLLPVPRAIRNLADLARSRPAVANEASAEAEFLTSTYCRVVSNPVFAAMGLSESLDEYCYQLSGVLRGDQVYWVSCNGHYDQLE